MQGKIQILIDNIQNMKQSKNFLDIRIMYILAAIIPFVLLVFSKEVRILLPPHTDWLQNYGKPRLDQCRESGYQG